MAAQGPENRKFSAPLPFSVNIFLHLAFIRSLAHFSTGAARLY
jgi:hypothetical protein